MVGFVDGRRVRQWGMVRLHAVLVVLLLSPALARATADEPPTIELEVGDKARLIGTAPICDDPKVAKISADGVGILEGVGVGTTLCSLWRGTGRQVLKIVVVEKKK